MTTASILVIDDEEHVLVVLKNFLQNEHGFHVVTAANAMEGLTKLVEDKFKLVIADVGLPGMNGVDMVQRITASYPEVKIIMISGKGDAKSIVRAMKAGADDYINKPFNLDEIAERVNILIKTDATRDTAKAFKKPIHSFGDYQIYNQLGSGGMGVVYRARQHSTGLFVALKILFPRLLKDEVSFRRFLREAELMGELDHPHIVKALDVGEVEGNHFIAMEYVDGHSLDDLVEEDGPIPFEEALAFIRQLFSVLAYMDEMKVIHRDIKPTNILIASGGLVKVVDFGLTKHVDRHQTVTEFGVAAGTAGFMPPEAIFEDDPLDIRADIYSLGATIYYMLTGELPFEGEAEDIFKAQRTDAPSVGELNVEVTGEFDRLVRKMMAPKRNDRFRTPADMIAAFGALPLPVRLNSPPEAL